jgi:hypothetical protein
MYINASEWDGNAQPALFAQASVGVGVLNGAVRRPVFAPQLWYVGVPHEPGQGGRVTVDVAKSRRNTPAPVERESSARFDSASDDSLTSNRPRAPGGQAHSSRNIVMGSTLPALAAGRTQAIDATASSAAAASSSEIGANPPVPSMPR